MKITSKNTRLTLVKLVHPSYSFYLLLPEACQLRQHKYRPLFNIEVEILTLKFSLNGKIEVLVSLGKSRHTFCTKVLAEKSYYTNEELITPEF